MELDANGKMMRDFSTINMEALKKFPVYKARPTWRIDRHMGSACAGDPPGFPSYFIQSIYTQYGNSPRNAHHTAPQAVIMGHVISSESTYYEKLEARLMYLWKPLPYDHPRVQAWIQDRYRHLKNMYYMPGVEVHGRTKMTSGPSVFSADFRMKTFIDDPRFSDVWRETEKAAVEAYNAELWEAWKKIAVPENYVATQLIKRYYPEHEYDAELAANPPQRIANWWETLPEYPTPENCPGDRSIRQQHEEGKPCQCCGRGYGEEKK